MSRKRKKTAVYKPRGETFTNAILPAVDKVFLGRKGTERGLNSTISQAMYQKELDAYHKKLEKQEAPKLPPAT